VGLGGIESSIESNQSIISEGKMSESRRSFALGFAKHKLRRRVENPSPVLREFEGSIRRVKHRPHG